MSILLRLWYLPSTLTRYHITRDWWVSCVTVMCRRCHTPNSRAKTEQLFLKQHQRCGSSKIELISHAASTLTKRPMFMPFAHFNIVLGFRSSSPPKNCVVFSPHGVHKGLKAKPPHKVPPCGDAFYPHRWPTSALRHQSTVIGFPQRTVPPLPNG